MKRKILRLLLVLLLSVGTASAQLGIVYDPTNYANALLRYGQLQQQLVQLKNSYTELVAEYNLALQMAKNIQDMPARYRAQFSQWENMVAQDTYGNTTDWVRAVDTGNIAEGYQEATTRLLAYNPTVLSGMASDELARVKSQYASVELADGANTLAIETVGSIRGHAQNIETQIDHLEQDSLSSDPNLNTEISVLNKINVSGILSLRTLQDSNKLLASLLEEQTVLAKQQREATTNTINADIARQASLAGNLNQLTGTLGRSLQSYRVP
jgi:hypothetical protein